CLMARPYSSSGTATPKSSAILTLLLHTEGGSSTAGEPLRFSPKADMKPRRRNRNSAVRRPPGGAAMCYRLGGSTDTDALIAEIFSYAKEPAVHPWTRGRFRASAGRNGEAAHQSSRPRIRAPAPQHRGTHAIDLRNDRRRIVVGRIGDGQPRGGGDQHVRPG